jgi:hypothetical protein
MTPGDPQRGRLDTSVSRWVMTPGRSSSAWASWPWARCCFVGDSHRFVGQVYWDDSGHPSAASKSPQLFLQRGPNSSVPLGPCCNGGVQVSAVTIGHSRFGGSAGRRLFSSGSCDDVGGRFGLWPRRSDRRRRAADRQQPVSVTTGEPTRRLWRIMTADPAIDGHSPGILGSLPRSSTPRNSLQERLVQISHGGSRGFKSRHLHPTSSMTRGTLVMLVLLYVFSCTQGQFHIPRPSSWRSVVPGLVRSSPIDQSWQGRNHAVRAA